MVWKKALTISFFGVFLFIFISCSSSSSSNDTNDNCTDGNCNNNGNICAKEGESCEKHTDCCSGLACDIWTHKCADITCSSNSDCKDPFYCDMQTGLCSSDCSSNADCGGNYKCINGQCQYPQPASDVASCIITDRKTVLHTDASFKFHAIALDADGNVIAGQDFVWSSTDSSVLDVADDGTATGVSAGQADITASVSGNESVTCSKTVTVIGSAGGVRVVVVDENTDNPVSGAKVIVNGNEVTTDNDGIAEVSGVSAPLDVHVFHDDYNYVSVLGTNSTDLLIALKKRPSDLAGGVGGKFDLSNPQATCKSCTVKLGLVGTSIYGNLMDLNFNVLLGEMVNVYIEAFDTNVTLPNGIAIGLNTWYKETAYAESESDVTVVWGTAGVEELQTILDIVSPLLENSDNIGDNVGEVAGKLISQLLPIFQKFWHFVKPEVHIDFYPRVPDTDDINANGDTSEMIPDYSKFKQMTFKVDQPLTLNLDVTVPELPKFGGTWTDGALTLIGSEVPGRGLVVLGLTAGVDSKDSNDTPNGKIDDPMSVAMAANHHGIEESQYLAVSLAISFSSFGGSGNLSTSGLVKFLDSIKDHGTVEFTDNYLGLAEGSSWDSATDTFTFATADNTAKIYRLVLNDNNTGRDWIIYSSLDNTSVTLPDFSEAAPFKDSDEPRIDLLDGITLDDLVEFNGNDMDYMVPLITRFSTLACSSPSDKNPSPLCEIK